MCAKISSTQKCFPNIFNKRGSTLQHSPANSLVTNVLCACYVTCHVWCFATPWAVPHQALLVHGILQAIILKWVAMPSSRGSSQTRDLPKPGIKPMFLRSPALARGFFTTICFSNLWIPDNALKFHHWRRKLGLTFLSQD